MTFICDCGHHKGKHVFIGDWFWCIGFNCDCEEYKPIRKKYY